MRVEYKGHHHISHLRFIKNHYMTLLYSTFFPLVSSFLCCVRATTHLEKKIAEQIKTIAITR